VAVVTRRIPASLALAIVALAACVLALAIATRAAFPGTVRANADAGAGCLAEFTPGDTWLHLTVKGRNREVLVHVPHLPAGDRVPLLIAVHGWAGSAAQFAGVTGFSAGGDQRGVVVAYPQGLGHPAGWHFSGLPSIDRGIRQADLALFDAIIGRLTAAGCADPDRVFIAGHSQGGGMAGELACRRADKLAGVAMISGEHFGLPCQPTRAIPILSLHAVDDEVLPYAGGRVTTMPHDFPRVLPAEQVAAAWAAIDGCDPVRPDPREDVAEGVTRISWAGCAAPVNFYRIASGGHAWAGAGPARVSATELVWSLIAGSAAG
jgi:polyhydroxybutyrate depolymerase